MRQPSPAPTPAPPRISHTKQASVMGPGSFKIIPRPEKMDEKLPEVVKSEEIVEEAAHGYQSASITNNTNIILIGGHTCKINTIANSPPEIIQYTSNQTTGCVANKSANRSGCRSVTKKGQVNVSPEKAVPISIRQKYFSNSKKFDDVLGKNSKSHSIITHKRSVSDTHGILINKKSNQSTLEQSQNNQPYPINHCAKKSILNPPQTAWATKSTKGEKHKKDNIVSMPASNIGSVQSSISAKPGAYMTEHHTSENSMEFVVSLGNKLNSGLSLHKSKDSKQEETLALTAKVPPKPIFINKVELLEKADISLKHDISKVKMDPKREKEMIELSEYIKKYYQDNKKAPPTNVMFYKIGKVLGKGAFGKVSLGIHKLTGKFVAIKSIHKQLMKDESSKNKVMREVAIWEQLSHSSVIRYFLIFAKIMKKII